MNDNDVDVKKEIKSTEAQLFWLINSFILSLGLIWFFTDIHVEAKDFLIGFLILSTISAMAGKGLFGIFGDLFSIYKNVFRSVIYWRKCIQADDKVFDSVVRDITQSDSES
ncbi:hypothetical protein [Hydrogenovibrio marinus]|uniref:Uncharacterized protein n=1 Tax=Hydrogenovibrio marinus TaxID=28885 RepID=A0A066ZQS3_HYDMR|nr:hypothetical protein [Hydrogenovibrio marinus]KDN94614.1 hypothetical protein EI16_11970 [Hydrogenovibrio marinus]